MKARDLMTDTELCSCEESCTMRKLAQMMADYDVGSVPVIDGTGKLVGMVTDRDLVVRGIAQDKSLNTTAADIMSRSVHSVGEDADLHQIETVMAEFKVRRVPVVDDQNNLQGIISTSDLIHKCHGLLKEHGLIDTLEAVCSPEAVAAGY